MGHYWKRVALMKARRPAPINQPISVFLAHLFYAKCLLDLDFFMSCVWRFQYDDNIRSGAGLQVVLKVSRGGGRGSISPPGKFFETKTFVGAFRRMQK